MKVGDIVICVDNTYQENRLVKGRKYVVYEMIKMPCGCMALDIGIISDACITRCHIHDCKRIKPNKKAHYFNNKRFRIIEPEKEYVVVQIESELLKEAKKSTQQKETSDA